MFEDLIKESNKRLEHTRISDRPCYKCKKPSGVLTIEADGTEIFSCGQHDPEKIREKKKQADKLTAWTALLESARQVVVDASDNHLSNLKEALALVDQVLKK